MLYKTHINTGVSSLLATTFITGTLNPIVLFSIPFLSLMADADHNKGMLAQTLGLKFGFLGHRNILHSAFGLMIVNIILFSIIAGLLFLVNKFGYTGFDINNIFTQNNIYSIGGFVILILGYIVIGGFLLSVFNKFLKKILGKNISNFLISIISVPLFLGLLYIIVKGYIAENVYLSLFAGFYFALISHLIGDYFTNTGFPLFYPISKIRIHFPITFSTGHLFENLLVNILTIANLVGLYYIVNNILHGGNLFKVINIDTNISIIIIIFLSMISLLIFKSDLNVLKKIKKETKNIKKLIGKIFTLIGFLFLMLILIVANIYILKTKPDILNILLVIDTIIALFLIKGISHVLGDTLDIIYNILITLFFIMLFMLFSISIYLLFY